MRASVYFYNIDERVNEAIALGHDDFVPRIREIPGFIAHYAIDLGNNEGLLLAIYKDDAGIKQFNEVAEEWVRTSVVPRLGPPYDQAPIRAAVGRVKAFNSPVERRLDLRPE